MTIPTDEQFERLIERALHELPQEYIANLDNVAITYADEPTAEQLGKQGVRHKNLLLGLYEGIPLIARGAGYSGVLPDKITIFKLPIIQISTSNDELYRQVKHTLWHEIAHHYGLDHDRIHKLEDKANADF